MRVSIFLAPAAPALKAVRNAKLMVNMWRRPKISLNGAHIKGPIYHIQLACISWNSPCTGGGISYSKAKDKQRNSKNDNFLLDSKGYNDLAHSTRVC